MKLCLFGILFVSLVHSWGDGAPASSVTEPVGGQAVLPCAYKGRESLSLSLIRLTWQTPSKKVVYAFDGGQSQPASQDVQYRERALVFEGQLEKGNLSLQVVNLTMADKGLYTCYLFARVEEEWKKAHESTVRLQVVAHFSAPVISGPPKGDIRPGSAVKLTCRAHGGYPEPQVNWTDGGGNCIPGNKTVEINREQDPVSRLWNVTSVLTVTVTDNSTFICSVFNSWTQETRTPAVWKYPGLSNDPSDSEPQTEPPGPGYLIVVYVLVAVFGFACLLTGIGCWLKRRKLYNGVATTDRAENQTEAPTSSTEMQNV